MYAPVLTIPVVILFSMENIVLMTPSRKGACLAQIINEFFA